jgi:hypothetical protein
MQTPIGDLSSRPFETLRVYTGLQSTCGNGIGAQRIGTAAGHALAEWGVAESFNGSERDPEGRDARGGEQRGLDTMSTLVFVVSALFFMYGIGSRLQRRDERISELADFDDRIRESMFWGGYGLDAARRARAEKLAEHKRWRNNIRFELANWAVLATGALIGLVATAIWINEDPTRTWDQLWDNAKTVVVYVPVAALSLYCIYALLKRLDKAEAEIKWLNQKMRAVKDHAEDMTKASDSHFLVVYERLDRLEEKIN